MSNDVNFQFMPKRASTEKQYGKQNLCFLQQISICYNLKFNVICKNADL